MYNIISSGSKGNCVIYLKSIAIDCGVPYSLIKSHINDLQIVLISHQHSDHLNISTMQKLAFERPGIRFGIGEFLKPFFDGIRNVDILEAGKLYDYGTFQISPVKLFHDVSNFGYRIFKDDIKILHCTDSGHLQGIEAKNYDLYAIESNYDEETINELIASKEANGEFAYQKGVKNSHLSEQQARDFIFKNRGENSKVLRLHETSLLK
jgi:L-ascorbate metabolism protein UlaG (beta-lactamase superfamily)